MPKSDNSGGSHQHPSPYRDSLAFLLLMIGGRMATAPTKRSGKPWLAESVSTPSTAVIWGLLLQDPKS